MNPAIIISLLAPMVPILVQEAEAKFGAGKGAEKRQWVIDGVHDVLTPLEKKVPAWAGTLITTAEPLIDDLINAGLTSAGLN